MTTFPIYANHFNMNNTFNISTKIKVRFADTDAMGHVNNANIFTYMEQGRVAYFSKLFPEVAVKNHFDAFPFVIAHIEANFISPAYCDETMVISLGITGIGNKSLKMEYLIVEETTNRQVATGKSTLVMYDYTQNKSIPIPPEYKQKIKELEKL